MKQSSSLAGGVWLLTKSGIEHVERHPVAFLRACDGDEALVTIILRLVNLDHAATDLSDLVDLLTTLANDGTDHVVGDVNLLSQGGAWHPSSRHWLGVGSAMWLRTRMRTLLVRWHMGRRRSIGSSSLSTIVNGHGRVWLRGVGMGAVLRGAVWLRRHRVSSRIWTTPSVSAIILPVTVVAASGLRQVRDYLHASRDHSCRATASSGIRRCRRSSESLVQLLKERAADVIRGYVHGICDAHNDQRALRGQRQA